MRVHVQEESREYTSRIPKRLLVSDNQYAVEICEGHLRPLVWDIAGAHWVSPFTHECPTFPLEFIKEAIDMYEEME